GMTNRIFCTTMGAATDLASEGLRRLVVNAVYWGLGMEESIPAKAEVTPVTPFKPTPFGFKGAKKNMRPADYALKK
ncbi:MAG: hypothetical protein HKO57_11600, partial [Akkermansiaceae bacterium]|nr:hypothetical protein [Akkermansiaceae bacterium]